MRFKELRSVLSRSDRLSVCDKNTLSYENFDTVSAVSAYYDEMLVCGIGLINSEFSKENKSKDITLLPCIEIVVSTEK
ncbi:MAG: hypothetical protein ACI4IG_01150 [Eubacterium sp.]